MMFIRLCYNLLFLLLLDFKVGLLSLSNVATAQNPSKNRIVRAGLLSNNYHYFINDTFPLPPGPIYAKGWLKYYTYKKNDANKLNEFFKNFEFYEQFKGGVVKNLNLADNVGSIDVPDEDHFFFVLTEKALNVLNSRKNQVAKTVDLLKVKTILIEQSDCEYKGGIEDLGDFLEGFCFKVVLHDIEKNEDRTWVICTNTREEKIYWMNVLVKLVMKLRMVKPKPKVVTIRNNTLNTTMRTITKKINRNVTWVAISPWSMCSKPCGGGKSYLHRICILPKNTTERCEGEKILTKDCNMEPCGNIDTTMQLPSSEINTQISKYADPIVKMMPVSRKPLRYEKCVIKDGDLALFLTEGSLKGAKIPARVLLNNQTITIYSSDNYESIITSHRLTQITNLRMYHQDKTNTCFQIEEMGKKTVLCAFISNRKTLPELADEWLKDIEYFTKYCSDYYNNNLDNAKMSISEEKVEETLDFIQQKEKKEMERIILQTQKLALEAVEKERRVENLIEKEEEEKENFKLELIKKKYNKMKDGKLQIEKSLERKKREADFITKKIEIKKKIAEIAGQTKKQIVAIRNELKNRLLAKRRDAQRKRQIFVDKMGDLKLEISKNLLKASKNGCEEECNPDRPEKEILLYCKNNYNDMVKLGECVKHESFCPLCCESEFGELHLEERSKCYNRCNDYYINKVKFKGDKALQLNIDIRPTSISKRLEALKTHSRMTQTSNRHLGIKKLDEETQETNEKNEETENTQDNESESDNNTESQRDFSNSSRESRVSKIVAEKTLLRHRNNQENSSQNPTSLKKELLRLIKKDLTELEED